MENYELNVLRDETNRGNSYSDYRLEKLKSIKHNVDCLISMLEKE